jgi:hypothetical protein
MCKRTCRQIKKMIYNWGLGLIHFKNINNVFMKTIEKVLKGLFFLTMLMYGNVSFSQVESDPRITDILKDKIGIKVIPQDLLTSFLEDETQKIRIEIILGYMDELKERGTKGEKKKISEKIEKYSVGLSEAFSKHLYKAILENRTSSDLNMSGRFPLLEKDIEKFINSSSDKCKKELRGLVNGNLQKVKTLIDQVQDVKSYELQLGDLILKDDPCNKVLVSSLDKLEDKYNELKEVKKSYENFVSSMLQELLLLSVDCIYDTKNSSYLGGIIEFKNVIVKQVEDIGLSFEDKVEWKSKNPCEKIEPVSNKECSKYLEEYKIDYSKAVGDFEKLGLARFKLNTLKSEGGRYACADKDFMAVYNSVNVNNDNSINILKGLVTDLESKLRKGKCSLETSDALSSLKQQNNYKVDFIKKDLVDLKESFEEFAIWIQENPCQKGESSGSEKCLDKNKERDADGECVCKKGFTPSQSGNCVSIADILTQSLSDNDETNDDCAELGKKYSKTFDNASIMVEELSLDVWYNAEVVHRFLADPTVLHCCNTGLTTSLSMVMKANEQIQSIWLGMAQNISEIMNDALYCPDEFYALTDKVRSIQETAELIEELEETLFEKWESYNCTVDDIKAATNRGIEDERRDALGSKIGGGTREIPCDGIDNDGDGEVDENSEDPEGDSAEVASEVDLYYAVRLSGHGYRKKWGPVEEYDGDQILIFHVTPLESIDEKVAVYEAGQIEGSDFWCKEGPRLCPCGVDPDIWSDGPYLEILDSAESRAEIYAQYDTNCDNKNGSFPCINWKITTVNADVLPPECR